MNREAKVPNFSRMINEILEIMTQTQAAERLQCSQASISRMRLQREPDPGYMLGDRIIKLHEELKQNG